MKITKLDYSTSGDAQTIPFGPRFISGPSLAAPLDSISDLIQGEITQNWQLALDSDECPTLRVDLDCKGLSYMHPSECPVGQGMLHWGAVNHAQLVFGHVASPGGWSPLNYWSVERSGLDTVFIPYLSSHARLVRVLLVNDSPSEVCNAVAGELSYLANLAGKSLRQPLPKKVSQAWHRVFAQLSLFDEIADSFLKEPFSSCKIVEEWIINCGHTQRDFPRLVAQLPEDHLALLLICLGCANSQLAADIVHPNYRGVHFIVQASPRPYSAFAEEFFLSDNIDHTGCDPTLILLDS